MRFVVRRYFPRSGKWIPRYHAHTWGWPCLALCRNLQSANHLGTPSRRRIFCQDRCDRRFCFALLAYRPTSASRWRLVRSPEKLEPTPRTAHPESFGCREKACCFEKCLGIGLRPLHVETESGHIRRWCIWAGPCANPPKPNTCGDFLGFGF